jgi:hypothetical protein
MSTKDDSQLAVPASLATEARATARRRTVFILATVCFIMFCVCVLAFGVFYLLGSTWPSSVGVMVIAACGLAISWLVIRRA